MGCKKDYSESKLTIEVSKRSDIEVNRTMKSGDNYPYKNTILSKYEMPLGDIKKCNVIARCDSGTNLIIKIDDRIVYNKYNTFHNYILK